MSLTIQEIYGHPEPGLLTAVVCQALLMLMYAYISINKDAGHEKSHEAVNVLVFSHGMLYR